MRRWLLPGAGLALLLLVQEALGQGLQLQAGWSARGLALLWGVTALALPAWAWRGARQRAWPLALLLPSLAVWALTLATQGGAAWQALRMPSDGLQGELQDGVLRLQGPLAAGDAARWRSALATAARVELQSPGGLPGEALALAAASPAPLLLVGECARECLLWFLNAPERWALPNASLQLQRLDLAGWNPLLRSALRSALRPALPLPPLLAQRQQLTPAPRLSRLYADALRPLLSAPPSPLLLRLPPAAPPASARPADAWAVALQSHAVWPALAARFPGAAQALTAELAQAPDDAARQQRAGQALQALAQRLRREADASLRLQALALLDQQLQAVAADADCRLLAAGSDAAVHGRLPAALQQRQIEWLREAAADPARDLAPLRGGERQMLGIALGAGRLAQLERLRAGQLDCAPARALLQQLQALPPAQRRAAAKHLFLWA